MVLSQSNSFSSNNNHCGCGSTPKCSMCLYKLICDKSPYCCINNSCNCDFTPIQNAINQLESEMSNGFSNLNTNINSVGALLNVVNNSINSIGAATNEINSKVDEILTKLPSTNVESESAEKIESQMLPVESNIIPTSKGNDTVLVEKKNIFGKTKWFE